MKELFKAGYYRLIFLGFNFLTGLFIAALSGAEAFGDLSLMVVNASLLYMITGLGTDQAIVWHGASDKSGTDKVFSFLTLSAILQLCLLILIAGVVFNITSHTILTGKTTDNYFTYEIVYFSGLIFLEKYVSILYAKQKSKTCNLVLAAITLIPLLYLCFTWLGVTHAQINPILFYSILLPIQALSVILYFHLSHSVKFILVNWVDLKPFVHFSAIVFITNLLQFIAYRADYWFIDYFTDATQVGIYAQANRFAQLVWIAPNVIAALLIPVITSDRNSKGEEVTVLSRIINAIHIPLLGVIALIAHFLYKYFLHSSYGEGFLPLLVMLPGFYFFTITILLAAYFSAKKLLWINFAGSAICLVVIIFIDWLLIPVFGITGAAWANLIAYTSATIFNITMFVRTTGFKWQQLFFAGGKDIKLVSQLFKQK